MEFFLFQDMILDPIAYSLNLLESHGVFGKPWMLCSVLQGGNASTVVEQEEKQQPKLKLRGGGSIMHIQCTRMTRMVSGVAM